MSKPTGTTSLSAETLFDKFKSLWDDLDPSLEMARSEAVELREAPGEVFHTESPQQLYDRLVIARRSLDRLEGIIAELGLIKSKCKQLVDDLQEEYDLAWIATMQSTRIGEYTSAKERDATYSVGALEQRMRLRRAERVYADIQAVYDFCQLKYRGLSNSQRDTETRLKARTERQ